MNLIKTKILFLLAVLSLILSHATTTNNTDSLVSNSIDNKSNTIEENSFVMLVDTNTLLSFDVDLKAFFVNNEYKRKVAYGYTLPGMRITPKFKYNFNKKLSFSFGATALRYWGANEYPYASYNVVPEYSKNSQKGLHILPNMCLNWTIIYNPYQQKSLNFQMGSIDVNDDSSLDFVLWNPELSISQDYQEGMKLSYGSRYFDNNTWLVWQNFNFKNDIDRESLLLGTHGSLHTDYYKSHSLFLSYALMWQHHGGELDTLVSLPLDHWLNGNLGLNYFYHNTSSYLRIAIDYYFSKALKNDTWFFKQGDAWLGSVNYAIKNYEFTIGYYYSKQMISLYGSPFFSNLCQRDNQDYYPENQLLYGRFSYELKPYNAFNLSAYTEIFYKLDDKTNLRKEDRSVSFSIGLVLDFNEKFTLLKR